MSIESALWAITASLFLAALGLPIPENPVLIGGGFAIFKQVSPLLSPIIWFAAIVIGDTILFALSFWFFTRPRMSRFLIRMAGAKRFRAYRVSFAAKGGWTLFLARFAYGIRAVAYIAAGAAHYPWTRFILVDSLSVALQVLLFVGIGYYAGERVDWAQDTGGRLVLVLGVLAAVSLLLTWGSTVLVRRLTRQQRD